MEWGVRVARALALRKPAPSVTHAPFRSSAVGAHLEQAIVFDDILPSQLLPSVLQQAEHHTSSSRLGTTWVDAMALNNTSGNQPRSPIEHAIRTLQGVLQPPQEWVDGGGGCEWWVQGLDVSDGSSVIDSGSARNSIPLHWDKDECEALRGGEKMTHPALASILYLTDVGGPTLILPVSTLRMNEWREAAVQDAIGADSNSAGGGVSRVGTALSGEVYASYPTANRWLTFQGDLLHGVVPSPSTMDLGTNTAHKHKRVTLLVNWWWAKPAGPCCERQSDDDAATAAHDATAFDFDSSSEGYRTTVPVPVKAAHIGIGARGGGEGVTGEGNALKCDTVHLQLPGLLGGGVLPLACPAVWKLATVTGTSSCTDSEMAGARACNVSDRERGEVRHTEGEPLQDSSSGFLRWNIQQQPSSEAFTSVSVSTASIASTAASDSDSTPNQANWWSWKW